VWYERVCDRQFSHSGFLYCEFRRGTKSLLSDRPPTFLSVTRGFSQGLKLSVLEADVYFVLRWRMRGVLRVCRSHMHHHGVVCDDDQSPFTHWHNNIIPSENKNVYCMTSDSHGDHYENCRPLRCDILYSGRILLSFRSNPLCTSMVKVNCTVVQVLRLCTVEV
jgi:hypothetical protein